MIVMEASATAEQIAAVVDEIKSCGLKADICRWDYQTVIGPIGDEKRLPFALLETFPGVKEARVTDMPYKLISQEYSGFSGKDGHRRAIQIGKVVVGDDEPVFIAGPCAVESQSQLFRIAEGVKKAGAHILRGGVFKPRSSVHSFQGLGGEDWQKAEEVLKWLSDAGQQFDMPVITEVRGEAQLDLLAEYVDILQIGARNMYDQDLLAAAARKKKPVLLKRHFGAGVEELLSLAEYIAAEGNKDIILCERGIVPVGKGKNYTRYMLDLAAVPVIKKETYLPVIVDPSHATGRRDLIFNMSCAAVAAGANGLMIEVHYDPGQALVDGKQMITPEELKGVIAACRNISELVAAKGS